MRLILSLFILTLILGLAPASSVRAEGDAALTFYHQGVSAKTMGEREQAFEKALQLYLSQYNKMKEVGEQNGMLCYNIGNCYFNLGQNEEAIFYYRLGTKLLPKNEKIKSNLVIALEKRENAVDIESSRLLQNILIFHYKMSAAQRIHAAIFLSLLAALSFLALILKPNMAMRYTAILSSLALICLFSSLAADYYSPCRTGILMQKADVRRGAGNEFAPVTPRPLGGGSSLEVLSLAEEWYLVKLNDGRKGFVPQKSLRVLTL